MPRGLPDYYNPDTLVSQRLANVEELFTLQRGLASLDNRGRGLYYCAFAEGVAGFIKASQNDGVDAVASINKAEIEPACMAMDAGTGSGAGSSYIEKRFRVQDLSSAGLELGIGYDSATPKITVTFAYDNGTNYIYGSLEIDQSAQTITIYDDGSFVTVYNLPAPQALTDWLIIKMVIDFVTPAYVRLLVGLDQIDISEYVLVSDASSLEGVLRSRILADPLDDGTNIAYIGHVAITIDEP